MRDAILANEHLYAGWDSVDAPKQFEIVKRLWDLHRRIYKRDTLDFKVDREPVGALLCRATHWLVTSEW